MKTDALTKKRKAQVFVTAIIVLAIVLTLGGALLFHSRSSRDVTKLQVDSDKAYSLAKSGMRIAEYYTDNHLNDPTMNLTTYNLGNGNITIGITFDQNSRKGTITSRGKMRQSTRVLAKNFNLPPAEGCVGEWAKVYNYGSADKLMSIQPVGDGFILAGRTGTTGSGSEDFLVIKIDCSGVVEWAKKYNATGTLGAGADTLWQIWPDGTGYVIGGYSTAFKLVYGESYLLIKTDSQGNLDWARSYSGYNESVTLGTAGFHGFFKVSDGYIFGEENTMNVPVLVKIDSSGAVGWGGQRRIYGTTDGGIHCVQEVSGGYVLAGWNAGGSLLIKANSQGDVGSAYSGTWAKNYDFASDDTLWQVRQTSDSGYILAGCNPPDNFKMFAIKTDSSGNRTWAKTYRGVVSGSGSFFYVDLQEVADGYIFARKGTNTQYLDSELLLIKTDFQGNLGTGYPGTWHKYYGVSGFQMNEEPYCLQLTADGFIFGGESKSYSSAGDFIVFKTNNAGQIPNCSLIYESTITVNTSTISGASAGITSSSNAVTSTVRTSNITVTDVTVSVNVTTACGQEP